MITYELDKWGGVEIQAPDGETVHFQSDWDYPDIAKGWGWAPCHNSTDGTVDCPECGRTATSLISAAYDYLEEHEGEEAEDPGYF